MNDYQCIAKDVTLGKDVFLSKFINLYGCEIGDRSRIGAFVEIQKGSKVGCDCKVSSHSFICEGVIIKNRVFIGHNVTFINDKYPSATKLDGSIKRDGDWTPLPTFIEEDVSIGSGAVILCGVTIGKGTTIGAGTSVVQNIPSNQVWVGNPAHFLKSKN